VAVGVQDSRSPAQFGGAIVGEKVFDHGAPFGGVQLGTDFPLRRKGFDCQRVGRLVERRA
jgi:hypothetical protein